MVFNKLFHKLPHLSIIAFIVKSWELFVVFGIIKLLRKIDEVMKKIAIIGAGYTGMIAARDLIKDNKVDIFEAEEKVGGMTATFEAYGTPLEKYYRHIFKSDSYVIDLIKKLQIEDKLFWPHTKMGYYSEGGAYEFGTPISLLKFKPLNLGNKFRFGLSVIRIKLIRHYEKLEKVSAHEWLIKHAGKKAYEMIWEPLLFSKFGASYKEVSMAWMGGKIVLRGSSTDKEGESLGYMKGSYQVLTEALEKDLLTKKVNIFNNCKVKQIKKNKNKYTIVTDKKNYSNYDMVLSTIAYPYFIDIANDLIDEKTKKNLSSIKYTAARIMVLFMKKPFMKFYWLNNGNKDIPFGGLIEHTNFIDKENYDNKHVMYISNYMYEDDELYNLTKEELFKKYIPMLKTINKDFSEKDVLRVEVFNERYAQPIITKNYSKIIPKFKIKNENIYIASMPQIYPEDRGLNYAIRLGHEVSKIMRKK